MKTKVESNTVLVSEEVTLTAKQVMAIKSAFDMFCKNSEDTIDTSVFFRSVEKSLHIDPASLTEKTKNQG